MLPQSRRILLAHPRLSTLTAHSTSLANAMHLHTPPCPLPCAQVLWPWSGGLGIYVRVRPEGAQFTGEAEGVIEFTVVSASLPGDASPERSSTVQVPFKARIVPTPPRHQRVLWDQFHSIR